ncbi:hypothetical protein [Paramagnetospirillum magneticum]|uniref:Mor transcription activator domain-containing protein n=1 Tax=Paramagnetospirillum magneticum (strain ATCC 700264 / AMB-1) TaxID=342108 RepID=Q2W6G6_PARM1|nr:hypothetical protein [Paramagnetospirillum magneticum]BAE50559.1 hypothetical protein amb1755 [Paramagnetospirillum magneticum AMB-1]
MNSHATNPDHLPGLLGELARRGHGGEALKLAAAWGGTKRYIPANPNPDNEICKVISLEAALVLAEQYGGKDNDIPRAAGLGSVKAALRRLDPGGTTDAARAVGCTARYVRMVRNGSKDKDGRQGELL